MTEKKPVPDSQLDMPSLEEVREALARVRTRERCRSTIRKSAYVLIIVAAISILISTLLMPVFRTYGDSMAPTLSGGDVVLSLKGSDYKNGEIVGLYVGNKLLIKRVIAGPGQWIDITEDGTVSVDGRNVNEPYVKEKALGNLNIKLPFQVPTGQYFVMGDNRSTSLDSRNTAVGCIAEDQIAGRVFFRIWPLDEFGFVMPGR